MRAAARDSQKSLLEQELKDKTLQLMSVQRNFDSMSRMMQAKQQELEQSRLGLSSEQAQVVSLSVKLEESLNRCSIMERRVDQLKNYPSQLEELQSSYDQLKKDAAQASIRFTSSNDTIKSLRDQLQEQEVLLRQLQRELDAARSREATRDSIAANLRQKVTEAEGDCRALRSETRALRDALVTAERQAIQSEQRVAEQSAAMSALEDELSASLEHLRRSQRLSAEMASTAAAGETALGAARAQIHVLEAQLRGDGRSLELAQQSLMETQKKCEDLEKQYIETKAIADQRDTQIYQLETQLSNLDEKYQASLSSKIQMDEVTSNLQIQLAQTRAALQQAKRNHQEQQQQVSATLADAKRRVQEATDHSSRLNRGVASLAHRHNEHIYITGNRLDAALERLSSLNEALLRGVATVQERTERALSVTQLKLHSWHGQFVEAEQRLLRLGALAETLASAARAREAERERLSDSAQKGMMERRDLSERISQLQSELSAALDSRDRLSNEMMAAEERWRRALADSEMFAEERLDSERRAMALKLEAVQNEVLQLQRAQYSAHQAANSSFQLERQQLQRQIAELLNEVKRLRQQLEDDESSARLAVLHTRYTADLAAAKEEYQAGLRLKQEREDQMRQHVTLGWGVAQRLYTDLSIVSKQLRQSGFKADPIDLPPELRGHADEGDGSRLMQLLGYIRVAFSRTADGAQAMSATIKAQQHRIQELSAKTASAESMSGWGAVAGNVRSTVAQLLAMEESLGSNCTCLVCLEVFKAPVTLIPCGHTYCRTCLASINGLCQECGGATPAALTIYNAQLDAICSKYEYKLSALRSVQRVVQGQEILVRPQQAAVLKEKQIQQYEAARKEKERERERERQERQDKERQEKLEREQLSAESSGYQDTDLLRGSVELTTGGAPAHSSSQPLVP
uniref:RING-type domain-containing protein n=1 Tax=Polytomella parva TaxID=51329 RepID=A0A7S0USN9_9CHLO|mmetsp:Transcript_13383/g.23710  ORF Transcript_13383/g.23710 Transcript_13383/m.23710 type:complete len:919 (+) Transcript_13383:266-3022(+)|eukprot:CAMPEP_0175071984 /NCGR_PEP_ID=MMETSP0052_2-20121109/19606_1 /TAXON_ID=51329 ORGANISM="Polytomella parva, Strain SAG 63-3" /NCGR_SAMPLE_ID=MMETSP0052_2 /ASSEMBLY_ACC=CAM_ASM_000194 /LENGTH=918 /DNA_ID=CAMNT_0016339335 /DNA_START=168 /DNA_END=2924 /DNA_ORIENTATION=+